jgi:CheY-like chemotaxis protein
MTDLEKEGGVAARLVAMADDDEAQAELVSGWLRMLGFRVMAFPHGDALAAWAGEPGATAPAAILLDVEMPGSDGFTTCRYLRSLPDFAEVPVACVSSIPADVLSSSAREAGATTSMRKDGELLPRLAEWLGES